MKLNYLSACSVVMLLCLLLFANPTTSSAQNASLAITGKVTGEAGKPMEGVTVTIKSSSVSTVTDQAGAYKIAGVNGTDVLVFSYVGYIPQEENVNNRAVINLSLMASQKVLEEVVMIGYGTQKKKNVTGAVSTFDARKLE